MAATGAEFNRCDWCQTEILPGAKKCPHCGEWQRGAASPPPVREAQIIDKGLVFWFKTLVTVTAIFAGFFLAVLGLDLKQSSDALQKARQAADLTRAEIEATAQKAGATDAMIQKLQTDVSTRADTFTKDLSRIAREAHGTSEQIRRELSDLIGDPLAEPEKGGFSLRSVADLVTKNQTDLAGLSERLDALERRLATSGETNSAPEAPPLSDTGLAELNARLSLLQTASEIDAPSGDGARRQFDVGLRLCATPTCDADDLGQIARVVYRFNQRWFAVPDVSVTDRRSNFAYSLRVWGSTTFAACIFAVGSPDRPIVRAGMMKLGDAPQRLGPDTALPAERCADLPSAG